MNSRVEVKILSLALINETAGVLPRLLMNFKNSLDRGRIVCTTPSGSIHRLVGNDVLFLRSVLSPCIRNRSNALGVFAVFAKMIVFWFRFGMRK